MEFTVTEIANTVNALSKIGPENLIGRRIIIRSACTAALPDSVFFDFRKFKDPANPIERMYALGVRIFVVNTLPENYSDYPDAAFLIVASVSQAINQYIIATFRNFGGRVIAVPNREGTCSVKDWMYSLLKPDFKVFTTLRYIDELDFLENVSNITNGFDVAILQIPDKYCFPSISTIEKMDNVIFSDDEFDFVYSFTETYGEVTVNEMENKKSYKVRIPFCDNIHAEDAAHCLCYLVKSGLFNPEVHNRIFLGLSTPDDQIKMRDAEDCMGIISLFSTVNNIYSVSKTFDFLARQHQFNGRTAVIMNPDFEDLTADEFFAELFFLAKSAGINKIVFIGYYAQIPHNDDIKITKYDTVQDYIDNFNVLEYQNRGIIFKGSKYDDFADIFDFFNIGNHDTVLEVSLTALKHNLNYYRSLLKPQTKMVAMVKANCYGSGSYQLANTLQNNGVDYLCVAFAEEGIALRRRNITMPILVMNYDLRNYKQLANYRLEPVLFSTERTKNFIEILRNRNIKNYPVHIKLDTGMHRSGFMESELDDFCQLYNSNKDIIDIKSMFTHFVAADDESEDAFSVLQTERFTKMADYICEKTGVKPLRHICNSVGIERLTQYQFDMVRLGIGLYGVAYQATDQLMGISKWKTNIVQIKHIPPTETVGYNRRGHVTCESRIALIPVGYADGLNRKFGNGNLFVEINGRRAPIIGNICMDMCMINITGIDCKVGDEVVIFGSNLKLIEMANAIGTIPYEILTGINQRVKRVYVE
ncbi:MAG: alanine racemase [Bacteroidales bacterium]|nr:alanine racemase [Bacteroidales bacterium]